MPGEDGCRLRRSVPREGTSWFLESLDAVQRAIQGTSDLGEALDAALGVVLNVLGSDRVWLLEAHAETWTAVTERTRPEYPGGLALGVRRPFTAEMARMHQRVLAADWCVQGGLEDIASMAVGGDVTPPRAVLAMGIYPKVGTPWIFVLHAVFVRADLGFGGRAPVRGDRPPGSPTL